MPQGQLDKLTDLSHLLSAATNIIVADLVEIALLIFALNGLAFGMNNGVLSNNGVLWWVDFDNLELDLPHAATSSEGIALAHWSICFTEVWGEEDFEEVAGNAFDSIRNREDGDALGILDVGAGVDGDDIAMLDTEIVADDAIYPSAAVVEIVICKDDEDCVFPLLALDQDCVATEETKRVHGVVREGDDGVVIVDGIGDTVATC